MKTAWAIRHVSFEDLGLLAPLLRARGYQIRMIDVPQEDLTTLDGRTPDLLIVLGGPMGARDTREHPFLAIEAQWLRQRRAAGLPSLGICLGAQVMAVSAGGDVAAMPRKEIGLAPVQVSAAGLQSCLRALAGGTAVLHWHGDAIQAPADAVILASTDACAVQAFALPGHGLGLQFHLEAQLQHIGQWTQGHAEELAQAGLDPHAIEHAAAVHADELQLVAQQVFSQWLDALPARPSPG